MKKASNGLSDFNVVDMTLPAERMKGNFSLQTCFCKIDVITF